MKGAGWKLGRANAPFLAGCVIFAAAVFVLAGEIASGWRIGKDMTVETCLPYRFYLIKLGKPVPERGELVAFKTSGQQPFADDLVFTKIVLGVPGDQVVVTPKGAQVAGKFLPFTERALKGIKRTGESLARSYTLGEGEYFMYATNPNAFDSRYYGPVTASKLIGESTPIW